MPAGPKLRAPKPSSPFQVVLVEPEIPPNTGAIARTCAATGSTLHLVGKLGFRIDEHSVRRAGLDYWPHVDLRQHDDWRAFEQQADTQRLHLLTSGARQSIFEAPIHPGDGFVFGKESTGLDPALLEAYDGQCWGIPTLGPVRSLNLSNAVAVVVFWALQTTRALTPASLVSSDSGDRL